MNLLKLPSQKVFAHHLVHATRAKPPGSSQDVSSPWKCQLSNKHFTILPTVWVQGIVIDVRDSGSTALIDDGTGIIVLTNCDRVQVNVTVSRGMYIMAVGSFEVRDQQALVKPFKLQDLSGSEHAEIMWPMEVLDQLNFLNS